MNIFLILRTAAVAAVLSFAAGGLFAADDHGHDHGAVPAATTGTAPPRFEAASDAFELVGVLQGKQLTLYLDRFADNSPVKDAALDLEIGGVKVQAEPHGDGVFEVLLAEAPKAGVLSVAAAVAAGEASDLLAGELDVHEAAHADAPPAGPRWQRWALWGVGALALSMAGVGLGRAVRASRQRAGGAA